MSFFNRLDRFLDSFSKVTNDEITTFGMEGERAAHKQMKNDDGLIIYNPIVPHPKDETKFLETDMLVYKNGRVYCVEVKNYKGKITFRPIYKVVYVEKRFLLFFKYKVKKTIVGEWDDSVIIKSKVGNHNEGVFTQEYPNPMRKTKGYINQLKKYLSIDDKRFNKVFITPIVAFNRKNTDISDIHSFEDGYIYIDELKNYLEWKSSEAKTNQFWITEGLSNLPTWDTVITTSNEEIYGLIHDDYINLIDEEGEKVKLKLREVVQIRLERGLFFSKEDKVKVVFSDNTTKTYKNVNETIALNKFGKIQKHNISNLTCINVGSQILRANNYL